MNASKRHGNTDFVMFLRAIAVNALAASIILLAYREGWLNTVFNADSIYISRTIIGLGLLGLIMTCWRIFNVSRELNIAHRYRALAEEKGGMAADQWLKNTGSLIASFVYKYRCASPGDKPILVDRLEKKMIRKFFILTPVEEWLVILGLLGTVVGFRIGLSLIDFSAFRDFALFGQLFTKIVGAFFIALDTTIVGICMALWLDINLKWILRPGMGELVDEAVDIGVFHE